MFIQGEAYQESYGKYNAQSTDAHQEYGTSYMQTLAAKNNGKVYTPVRDNRNILRLMTAMFSMLMLLPFAFFFKIFVQGPQGWIGFSIASFVIFLIAVVTIDKVQ